MKATAQSSDGDILSFVISQLASFNISMFSLRKGEQAHKDGPVFEWFIDGSL